MRFTRKWHSVKDGLPKKSGYYWCNIVLDFCDAPIQTELFFDTQKEFLLPFKDNTVTHWVELPPVPKETNNINK